MAFTLEQLTRPEVRPIIATIVAEHGLGKSTLAAMFPAPVVIRAEDGFGLEHNVDMFPVVKQSSEILEQIDTLGQSDHAFQTLIIDSVTEANTLIEHEIVAADKKAKSINQAGGGYGAGYGAAAEIHRQIRERCGFLSKIKNMNIVFIAHADSETVDPPDADPYTRYTVRMNKKSVPHYTDNVDLVAFIKLKTFSSGASFDDEGLARAGKATTTGQRIITCYPTPNHISKNRFGIETDLVFERGVNPLVEYIPQLQKTEV